MIRKTLATLAVAAGLLGATAGTAAATTTPRHSDFYVKVASSWVAEDQLTQSQLDFLATGDNCQPVQYAVLVPNLANSQMRAGFVSVTILQRINGGYLINVSDATGAQLSQANFDQLGLTIPSFIGPDHYSYANGSYSC